MVVLNCNIVVAQTLFTTYTHSRADDRTLVFWRTPALTRSAALSVTLVMVSQTLIFYGTFEQTKGADGTDTSTVVRKA